MYKNVGSVSYIIFVLRYYFLRVHVHRKTYDVCNNFPLWMEILICRDMVLRKGKYIQARTR